MAFIINAKPKQICSAVKISHTSDTYWSNRKSLFKKKKKKLNIGRYIGQPLEFMNNLHANWFCLSYVNKAQVLPWQ